MIFPFVELPHIPGGWPRPVLDVVVGNMGEVLMPCLVDSGAMNTYLPRWVANLSDRLRGRTSEDPRCRRFQYQGADGADALLTIGEHSWEAEVGFCDPWPHGWGLLGQLSFFRYFVVTFRAADFELEINPVQRRRENGCTPSQDAP